MPTGFRHLRPRLLENTHDLLVGMLAFEVAELVVEEDQAGYIFQNLRLLHPLPQAFLLDQRDASLYVFPGIPALRQYLADLAGLPVLQICSPAVVPSLCQRILVSSDLLHHRARLVSPPL